MVCEIYAFYVMKAAELFVFYTKLKKIKIMLAFFSWV